MTKQLNEIEALIDGANVKEVLSLIATICLDKADHIEASYSDRALYKAWLKAAGMIRTCANKLPTTPGIGYGN